MGRFLSVDPIAAQYPFNSPYAFAENKVIAFVELEGLEIALPRIGWNLLPRPVINLPKAPSIPIPSPPTYPLPPIIVDPTVNPIPAYPTTPTQKLNFESAIDWNNPPASPQELGDSWEETTHPDNKSGSRDFRHKKTGEEIRWDPGKSDKPGWEGKDHWHRHNPNKTNKGDYYLDRFGNAVPKGSGPSHIGAGQSFLEAIPGLIQDMQGRLDDLQKERDKLSIFNMDDWDAIKSISDKMSEIENYMDELNDYKEEWDEYYQDLKEYYENCNCGG